MTIPVEGGRAPRSMVLHVALNMPELVTVYVLLHGAACAKPRSLGTGGASPHRAAVCPTAHVKRDRIIDGLRYVTQVNVSLGDGCIEFDARDGEVRPRRSYVSTKDVDRSVRVMMDILKRLKQAGCQVFADVARLNEYAGSNRSRFALELARNTVTAVFKDSDGQSIAEALAAAKRF